MAGDAKYNEYQLIAQLHSGDKAAFSILYTRYSGKVYNFVQSALFDKSLAEDITQNCFLKVWEKRATIDPQKSFSGYLFTIARNLVYKATEQMILDNKFQEHEKGHLTELSTDTLEKINSASLNEYVEALIEKLPEARRQIFRLKKNGSLTNKEIAQQLSISEKTVETQLYRSMNYLREKLRHYIMTLFL